MGNHRENEIGSKSFTIDKCRICGKDELKSYLNLGMLPLANNLGETREDAISKDCFPLNVLFCPNCSLSQLSEVVDPRVLYSHYLYRSDMSQGYINHCKQMALDLRKKYNIIDNVSFVVDVAGNTGTLLEQFRELMPNLKVLNIDPAKNLAPICRNKKIPVLTEFFSINSAMDTFLSYGKADIITATNVFAHVNSVRDFILSAKFLLHVNGVLVLEFPYIKDYIDDLEFSTSYHEHLSYIGITPLALLCKETDMKIISVEKQDIHCGTVRVEITHNTSNRVIEKSVDEFLNLEENEGFNSILKYIDWQLNVDNLVDELKSTVYKIKAEGKTVVGFAGSAKGNTLLNACGFTDNEISYIVDDTPEKQGKFSPKTGIKIVSVDELKVNKPDYILILAWNFTEEIIKRLDGLYDGKFIIPVPEVVIR